MRSFLAIVRFGGYHRAAEALHLTQPAVSRHMRRLEEQLGAPLFAKAGRGVELTPFGERAAAELSGALGVLALFTEGRDEMAWLRHLYEGWRVRAEGEGGARGWCRHSVLLPFAPTSGTP